jgi:hypothetical protein
MAEGPWCRPGKGPFIAVFLDHAWEKQVKGKSQSILTQYDESAEIPEIYSQG